MVVKTIWNTLDADALLAHMARVSNPANQNSRDIVGLISYLIRKRHWSPFDMVNLCVEIRTTRDIGRQVLRHWSMMMHDLKVQEFSQRYADVSALEGPELRPARLQDAKNRQSSIETDDCELQEWWVNTQQSVWDNNAEEYDRALKRGIAKEQARALLPEGMTPTVFYLNGTARQWMHYLDLRMDEGTQKEHRDVAIDIAWEFSHWAPATWAAYENDRQARAKQSERVARAIEVKEAYRYFIDASEIELKEAGTDRMAALATARTLDEAFRREFGE